MKRDVWNLWWAAIIAGVLLVAQPVVADVPDNTNESAADESEADKADAKEEESEEVVDEIVVLGTRSTRPRSVTDSPVPVDVITAEDFNALGNAADLTDNLKMLVPSYTATPATGDGSAFIRPTSLRGMAPDQTLVLVNGKRRHRSALVQFFAPAAGNGAHGVDIGMIPNIAIKRVEVLRDGAAAQYGSDAIAGVINFEMKDASDGTELQLQVGQFYEGESSVKAAFNTGFAVGERGFVNLSVERTDNEALSRGVQRPDAQALIDAGVPGVGADTPFGDAPLAQTWGRPQTSGTRFFLNSGFEVGEDSEFYLQSGFADTSGRYRFFYRNPLHSTLVALGGPNGLASLPAGYTPYLDGDQTDFSLVAGLKGMFGNGTVYDFSVSYGMNQLDYFLNNTVNPDLGLDPSGTRPAQRNFDVGGYKQEETNLNADFSQPLGDKFNLAYGFEWREETYTAMVGEPNSYLGAGSNGLKGISPSDAGSWSRDNTAAYADLEHDVTTDFLMQYALRVENYSDFGTTVNGKIATRYSASPTLTLRAAVSTGFHAPTPGQANVRTTITTFDGVTGLQVEEGLVPSTSPLVAAVGGKALTEETSVNYSTGFSKDIGANMTVTLDAYRIEVNDRIYRTGDIPHPNPSAPGQTISFYTNALDIVSEGLELVLTASAGNTDLTLAASYNQIDVVGQTPVGGVNPVSDGIIEDIENNYPNERVVLTTHTRLGEAWSLLTRLNYYGKHYDERGRIGAAVDPSAEIAATAYLDLELGWDVSESFRVALGAINVLDQYVGEINSPFANRQSVGLQYPRRSAANYEGGSFYLRGSFRF